ncbi:MAG: CNP1-like family protein [Polaromonas sp.]|nr:CNP1-like family protein [Polaromonas sp.]
MKLKQVLPVVLLALLGCAPAAMAQGLNEDKADWKESAVPPPPAFSTDKLATFEVTLSSELTYGIDPATIAIDRQDGVVRYVMVASSRSGARNVVYEGIRCSTGEVRTYARNYDGKWSETPQSEWRSLYLGSSTRPALRLAQAGVCDNVAYILTPREIVERMKKNPNLAHN